MGSTALSAMSSTRLRWKYTRVALCLFVSTSKFLFDFKEVRRGCDALGVVKAYGALGDGVKARGEQESTGESVSGKELSLLGRPSMS